jgi:hypothetical protein
MTTAWFTLLSWLAIVVACPILAALFVYIVHERLDLARFNRQANESGCPSGVPNAAKTSDGTRNEGEK